MQLHLKWVVSADTISNPNAISLYVVHHGVGANMLKTESKRRRTKQQIEEDKQAEVAKENAMRTHMAQVQELQAQKEQAEHAAATNRGAAQLMSDLINAGIVK